MTINKRKRDALAVFCAAIELSSVAEQDEYVENACDDNPELRREVEALLKSNRDAGSFLADDGRATSLFVTPNADTVREAAGSRIGRYKLLQQIGEGGFGVVFMAEQQEPVHRKVALKIIKRGMDTKEVVARFEAERQALALMDHPNIARVLDGGETESGRPYFAMELVRGVPLTEFCDTNKLSVNDRVKLFVTVCRAIEHAHKKGIIHRDLKPSNVMVTLHDSQPVPKIIDFGVSKAITQRLTEKTLFTAYGQMVGTPVYMSPEQARFSGLDIDTRSDVYSLGVLLYELLTGTTPLCAEKVRTTGYAEMQRMIVEEEAPNPSTRLSTLGDQKASIAIFRGTDSKELQQFLRGDLDWIVMKALEKERNRRYQSASDFADDIQRFLTDDEIEARPPSTAYKLQKFVRRNRGLVIGATALLAMLCLGLLGTSLGLVAAKRAATSESKARAVAVAKEQLASAHAKTARDAESKARYEESQAKSAKQDAEAAKKRADDARDAAKNSAEINRQLLYAANVQLASSGNNNIEGDAHGLLAAWIPAEPPTPEKPDLREFAWRRQWTRLYEGGIHSVLDTSAVAISPGGNLVTADGQGIREWFPTGKLLAWRWQGDATRAVFSPNGRWALIPTFEGLQLVDIPSGNTVHTFEMNRHIFSADSQSIAIWGTSGDIEIFKVGGKSVVPSGSISGQAFDSLPSASQLFLAPGGRSYVQRTPANTMAGVFANRELPLVWRHASGSHACAWSADGQIVASGDNAGQIFLRHALQPEKHETVGTYGKGIGALCFSPDSTQLAAGRGNGTTELWDISITDHGVSAEISKILGGNASIRSLMFSDDGTKLATLDHRRTATLWELSNPDGRHEFKRSVYDHIGDIGVIWENDGSELRVRELIPDGPAAKSGKIRIGDRALRITDDSGDRALDIPTGVSAGPRDSLIQIEIEKQASSERDVVELARSMPVQFYGYDQLAISPSGKFVTVANSIVGATCWTTDGQFVRSYPAKGSSVRYSSDERFLALEDTNEVVLWDLKNDQLRKSLPFECTFLAFSPDARHLAFGTRSEELHIWELASLTQVADLRGGYREGAFTPNGDLFVAVDRDRNVIVWNTTSWEVERSFQVGNGGPMVVSPNGTAIAIGGSWTVELWDIRTGVFIRHIASPTNPHSLAFSPDGRTLASGTVFWDANTGNPLRYYREHDTIMRGAEFSRDGEILASLSTDGELYVQRAKSFEEIERHPLTLRSIYDLASLRDKQRRFAEAEAILRYTLERQNTSLSPEHSDIADTRSLLKRVLVAQGKLPEVSSPPRSRGIALGESAHFKVTTTRAGAWTYQWFHNGTAIAGATESWLTISDVKTINFGRYHVEIEAEEYRSMVTATRSDIAFLVDKQTRIASGCLLREVFRNTTGMSVEELKESKKFQSDQPDSVDAVDSWEAPRDFDENYGQRIHGFLLPPKTGDYVFYLASDDASELYISSDESPDNCRLVAEVAVTTRGMSPRGWLERPGAVSKPIHLEAGKRYAVQTLMKEGRWGDHLAVTWQMPGEPRPKNGDPPIAGEYLECLVPSGYPAELGN